jgi:hypothetical protein
MHFSTNRETAGSIALALAVFVAIGVAAYSFLTQWTEPGKDAAIAKLHQELVTLGEKLQEPEPSVASASTPSAPETSKRQAPYPACRCCT